MLDRLIEMRVFAFVLLHFLGATVLIGCNTQDSRDLVPTPKPGSGVVFGTLRSVTEQKPMADQIVLLARLLEGTATDGMGVASLDAKSAPKSISDSMGRFFITDVPPDRYALALMIPTGYVVLRNPATGKEIVFTVTAGASVDLAEVSVEGPIFR